MNLRISTQCATMFAFLFAAMACSEVDAIDADDALDSATKSLQLVDEDGNMYELPYRADLSPGQVAELMSVTLKDEEGNDIALTPVRGKATGDDEPTAEMPAAMEFEVWPVRRVAASDEDVNKVWLNGIAGATTCWSYQDVPYGQSNWYHINNAFASDGWVHGSNTSVDYDLRYYINGYLICSSTLGANRVDSCAGYNSGAGNVTHDYQVYRYNTYSGTYRFCASYWWSY